MMAKQIPKESGPEQKSVNPKVPTVKSRGSYQTLSSGNLPKRQSDASIQKLVEKAATRGIALDLSKKALKKREVENQNLKSLLQESEAEKQTLLSQHENQLKEQRETIQELQEENNLLNHELSEWKNLDQTSKNLPVPVKKKKSPLGFLGLEILTECVSAPDRVIAFILKKMAEALGYEATSTVSHQTLINDTCRAGLAILQDQKPRNEPWVGLVDYTMNQGPVRVLVFCALSESGMNQNSAMTLKNTECIDVIPMVDTTGPEIAKSYEKLFDKVGHPSAFLQDQGSNLTAAVNLINQKRIQDQLEPIPIIYDVGHFSANLVKKNFSHEEAIKKLLTQVNDFNAKIRLTSYAFLQGPVARSAGRYMGHLKKIVHWLYDLKKYMKEDGKPTPEENLKSFILKNFPQFLSLLTEVQALALVIKFEEFLLTEIKNKGLNRFTYQAIKKKLMQLPKTHFYRVGMLNWLNQTWKIKEKIGIKGSLCVSSDIIETTNGQWKTITKRSPSKETTHLVLAIPTFFGTHTPEQLEKLVSQVSTSELQRWIRENLPISQRKLKKMNFRGSTLMSTIDKLIEHGMPQIGTSEVF